VIGISHRMAHVDLLYMTYIKILGLGKGLRGIYLGRLCKYILGGLTRYISYQQRDNNTKNICLTSQGLLFCIVYI
jgi:hypothetical protein